MAVIEEFLSEQSFSFLCQHLLIILEEQGFHLFLNLIPKYIKLKKKSFGSGDASDWLDIILKKYGGSSSIDQLLLLNAVTNEGRHLLRLVQEEGGSEEKEKIKHLVSQLCESSSGADDLAPLIEEGLRRKPLELITRLGIQSWVIYFSLSKEFRSPEYWESLFASNGIKSLKSNKYALLHDGESSEDSGSDYDGRSFARRKGKKHRKHKRRKRKHNYDADESDEDELVGFDSSNNISKSADWLLSTDDYAATWSSVDLPEHLSKHCLITWQKWVFSKWNIILDP